MSAFQLKVSGADIIAANLAAIVGNRQLVERAAVGVGVGVLSRAAKAASPGSTKRESGGFVEKTSSPTTGRAGLLMFPERGKKYTPGTKPHAIFLEAGTKYITPRRFVSLSLAAATSRAMRSMEMAARGKIARLINPA